MKISEMSGLQEQLNKMKEFILSYTKTYPLTVEVEFAFQDISSTARSGIDVTFGIFLSDPVVIGPVRKRTTVLRMTHRMKDSSTPSQNEAIREITNDVMKALVHTALSSMYNEKKKIMDADIEYEEEVPSYTI